MDLMLSDRHALVTGGSRGIGLGIVRELAAEGAAVVFCGRDAQSGHDVERELRARGQNVTFMVGDLMSEQGVADVAKAASQVGRIDILVNNVGGANDPDAGARPFEDIPPGDWVGAHHQHIEHGRAGAGYRAGRLCRRQGRDERDDGQPVAVAGENGGDRERGGTGADPDRFDRSLHGMDCHGPGLAGNRRRAGSPVPGRRAAAENIADGPAG
ncbi:MAG: hypothetical protein B7Z36_03340 [Novosphingobium sp. 12-63-9]|nr:MAG: hypothetical protein B7Z36_03340 [Novosphingobium sp. 12-63-9]